MKAKQRNDSQLIDVQKCYEWFWSLQTKAEELHGIKIFKISIEFDCPSHNGSTDICGSVSMAIPRDLIEMEGLMETEGGDVPVYKIEKLVPPGMSLVSKNIVGAITGDRFVKVPMEGLVEVDLYFELMKPHGTHGSLLL